MLIYEIIPKVMEEIGAIDKSQTNRHQGYQFRGVDDVLNACGPVFSKYGVTLAPRVTSHSVSQHIMQTKSGDKPRFHAVLQMTVTLFAKDGSSVEFASAGEAFSVDGDKATAAAMSNAYKYALFLGLCIPVDRDCIEDGDRCDSEHEESPQQRELPSRGRTNGNSAVSEQQQAFADKFAERIGQAGSEQELDVIASEIKSVFPNDGDMHRASLAAPYKARLMLLRNRQLASVE